MSYDYWQQDDEYEEEEDAEEPSYTIHDVPTSKIYKVQRLDDIIPEVVVYPSVDNAAAYQVAKVTSVKAVLLNASVAVSRFRDVAFSP
ncbi:hypothetical protein Q1695_005329 [Nippostrongylus brasiliensis]|nr:hypothetical protein Q1695_005329 [Nippostrongylus brasiliensis]